MVSDTGIGIAHAHLSKIFERFYRVDPARGGDGPGAGLGLAICRSVVVSAGGSIVATSVLERGSEFTVRLPAIM